MKLLLDTCAFLWLATAPVRLSKAAIDAIGGSFQFVTVDKIFDEMGVDLIW